MHRGIPCELRPYTACWWPNTSRSHAITSKKCSLIRFIWCGTNLPHQRWKITTVFSISWIYELYIIAKLYKKVHIQCPVVRVVVKYALCHTDGCTQMDDKWDMQHDVSHWRHGICLEIDRVIKWFRKQVGIVYGLLWILEAYGVHRYRGQFVESSLACGWLFIKQNCSLRAFHCKDPG